MRELILGGARSGKSRLAEKLAADSGLAVTYIATSQALDGEMNSRIRQHRERRPADWALIEEPIELARVLRESAHAERCLLVDCLTLWLSNMLAAGDERLEAEISDLTRTLPTLPGQLLLVSNEVGQGIVPANPLARRFRDQAGLLHQSTAACCDRVTFVIAGLPLTLKDSPA